MISSGASCAARERSCAPACSPACAAVAGAGAAVAARLAELGAELAPEGAPDVLVYEGAEMSGRAALDEAWDAIRAARVDWATAC